MRKIEREHENPIDDIIILICEKTQYIFHDIGFNPNGITTLSLLFGIMSSIQILNKNFIFAGILYFISYFFDCMDGNMARTYNQVTVFGDYYDHISDIIKIVLILTSLYIVDSKKIIKIFPFILILSLLSFYHLSCQELYFNNEANSEEKNLIVY